MKPVRIVALLILSALVLYLLYVTLPPWSAQDWQQSFCPATIMLSQGLNPYGIPEYYNAPWTLLPFIPLVYLPYQAGRVGLFIMGMLGFAYVARKSNAGLPSTVLFLTSFPVVTCLFGGGLDWIPLLGFVTPAPIALILSATKPQIGLGIAAYWLLTSWQTGGVRAVVLNFAPVAILLLASFYVYGFWVAKFDHKWLDPMNTSAWPWLIPIGIYLLWTQQKRAAGGALLLSPYYTFFSVPALLIGLFEHPRWMFVVWCVLWSFPLVRWSILH